MHGVVTLAGDGSRMLPWARGLRKEFLPLFDRPSAPGGEPVLKPVTHLVVETLLAAHVSDIVLVVRPDNLGFVRTYFTIDPELLRRHAHQPDRIRETAHFYRALSDLNLSIRLQRRPNGFGDAVRRAEPEVGSEPFVVHAGDAVVIERDRGAILRAMIRLREKEELDAVLLVRRVQNPRRYGVVEGRRLPSFDGIGRLRVTGMEEKPDEPRSNWAATAVYVFGPKLWTALRGESRRRPAELELTAGIQRMLRAGGRVEALVLSSRHGRWRSVGSPERYARALLETQRLASRPARPRARSA